MGTRSVEILPDHFYHLYNRGNNKQSIFRTRENFRFFLRTFRKYFSEERIRLVAYCLMPNHFHLLILILQKFDFSNVMRSFSTSYVKSFHSWHKTSGHLFEDDYQAKLIRDDKHLIEVIPYIHLNPVIARLVQHPEEWEFSDCNVWCQDRAGNEIRKQLYGSAASYHRYLNEYATRKRKIQALERRLLGW